MLPYLMAFLLLLGMIPAAQAGQQPQEPVVVASVAAAVPSQPATGTAPGAAPAKSVDMLEIPTLDTAVANSGPGGAASVFMISASSSRGGDSTTQVPAANSTLAIIASGNAMMIAPIMSEPKVEHSFWDKKNMVGFAIHGAIRIADSAQSCALLDRPGRHETWLPVKSCAGITIYSMAMLPAQIGSSYLLHRRGHHRMERWMPYVWAAPSAAGIAFSMGAW